jgi:hypothetical protein
LVETVLLEEVIQGDAGNADLPGAVDESDDVSAAGLRVGEEELGDGSGKAGQEFAVGTTVHAVMGGLNGLLGREPLLAGSGGAIEADETCQLGDLEATVAVQQEMAEDARRVVIVAALLAEVEDTVENTALLGSEPIHGDACRGEPVSQSVRADDHDGNLLVGSAGRIVFRRGQKLTVRCRKTVWC